MKNHSLSDIARRIDDAEDFTLFVVGDSITQGTRATDDEHTYTAVLARLLAERYATASVVRYDGKVKSALPSWEWELLPLRDYAGPISVKEGDGKCVTVVRSGIGGNTVRRLLNRKDDFIGKAVGGKEADLYTVMVGINDALNDPRKFVPPAVYKNDLEELVKELESGNPDADLIFITPSYNDDGTRHESHLAPYALAMKEVAEKYGIPLIDMHAVWMAHLACGAPNYGQGDWLSGHPGDSCHPSNEGHAVIANEIYRHIFGEG